MLMWRQARERPKRLPEKLIQIRLELGLSQNQMLDKLGLSEKLMLDVGAKVCDRTNETLARSWQDGSFL
jgi:transcriptional regulator with XRE-family HTH domain